MEHFRTRLVSIQPYFSGWDEGFRVCHCRSFIVHNFNWKISPQNVIPFVYILFLLIYITHFIVNFTFCVNCNVWFSFLLSSIVILLMSQGHIYNYDYLWSCPISKVNFKSLKLHNKWNINLSQFLFLLLLLLLIIVVIIIIMLQMKLLLWVKLWQERVH